MRRRSGCRGDEHLLSRADREGQPRARDGGGQLDPRPTFSRERPARRGSGRSAGRGRAASRSAGWSDPGRRARRPAARSASGSATRSGPPAGPEYADAHVVPAQRRGEPPDDAGRTQRRRQLTQRVAQGGPASGRCWRRGDGGLLPPGQLPGERYCGGGEGGGGGDRPVGVSSAMAPTRSVAGASATASSVVTRAVSPATRASSARSSATIATARPRGPKQGRQQPTTVKRRGRRPGRCLSHLAGRPCASASSISVCPVAGSRTARQRPQLPPREPVRGDVEVIPADAELQQAGHDPRDVPGADLAAASRQVSSGQASSSARRSGRSSWPPPGAARRASPALLLGRPLCWTDRARASSARGHRARSRPARSVPMPRRPAWGRGRGAARPRPRPPTRARSRTGRAGTAPAPRAPGRPRCACRACRASRRRPSPSVQHDDHLRSSVDAERWGRPGPGEEAVDRGQRRVAERAADYRGQGQPGQVGADGRVDGRRSLSRATRSASAICLAAAMHLLGQRDLGGLRPAPASSAADASRSAAWAASAPARWRRSGRPGGGSARSLAPPARRQTWVERPPAARSGAAQAACTTPCSDGARSA